MAHRIDLRELRTLAVRHNGVFIPGRRLEALLDSYCQSLAVWNDNETYPISLPGSATPLRYKDRFMLVCNRHQLRGSDMENVCIMQPQDGQTHCVTSGGARWFEEVYENEIHELAVFDFTEPCADIPDLRQLFFDFRSQHPDFPKEQIVAMLAYGYPTKFTKYDFENGRIVRTRAKVSCQFEGGGSDDSVHVLAPTEPLSFDPDGMSGGPVFCLRYDGDEFSLHFAGVTATGGSKRLRVIKAGAIQAMMDIHRQG